jgi:uncharacterized membrane protein HdeD (DUF308 family)
VAPNLDGASQRSAYWLFAVVRALPVAAVALWITFTANHSATFGLLAFGLFGVVGGVVLGVLAFFRLRLSRVRSFFLAQAIVTIVAGGIALAIPTGGTPYLFFVLTLFAAITGLLELFSGVRSRGRFVAARDWMAVGAFTIIAAIVFLLIPPGFTQSFKDPDGVVRVLDSAVIAVGVLGAYAAIVTVYLLIAGLSAKWDTQAAPAHQSAQSAQAAPAVQLSEAQPTSTTTDTTTEGETTA